MLMQHYQNMPVINPPGKPIPYLSVELFDLCLQALQSWPIDKLQGDLELVHFSRLVKEPQFTIPIFIDSMTAMGFIEQPDTNNHKIKLTPRGLRLAYGGERLAAAIWEGLRDCFGQDFMTACLEQKHFDIKVTLLENCLKHSCEYQDLFVDSVCALFRSLMSKVLPYRESIGNSLSSRALDCTFKEDSPEINSPHQRDRKSDAASLPVTSRDDLPEQQRSLLKMPPLRFSFTIPFMEAFTNPGRTFVDVAIAKWTELRTTNSIPPEITGERFGVPVFEINVSSEDVKVTVWYRKA